jgi:hypothetical protein
MQAIESDRISSLEQLIKKLSLQINLVSKKVTKIAEVYDSIKINISEDIRTACKKYGTRTNEQEVYLYDIYAENTKNMMNKDRRIDNLNRWSDWFKLDIQEQIKAKNGLEKFRNFALNNPNFNSHNEAEVDLKLKSVNLLQTLYEASLFKVQSALSECNDQPKPQAQYANMLTTYDRQVI